MSLPNSRKAPENGSLGQGRAAQEPRRPKGVGERGLGGKGNQPGGGCQRQGVNRHGDSGKQCKQQDAKRAAVVLLGQVVSPHLGGHPMQRRNHRIAADNPDQYLVGHSGLPAPP